METTENKKLQKIRKDEINNVIGKYKTLFDAIITQVSTEFPTFKNIDIKNNDGEITNTITAEEQLYNFMLMRENAVDHADRMLNKINLLEIELNAPELYNVINNTDDETKNSQTPVKKNWTKKAAESTKK